MIVVDVGLNGRYPRSTGDWEKKIRRRDFFQWTT